ncbi:Oxidoreductase [Klebsiella aerogenes]|nr:Oxidoreductase [Klebsiella aerogenes]
MRLSSNRCSGCCQETGKRFPARDVAIALLAEALSPSQEGVQILTSSQLRERAAQQAE